MPNLDNLHRRRKRPSRWPLLAAIVLAIATVGCVSGRADPLLDDVRAIGVREESQAALSRRLVVAALDSEALYTLWDGLKPVSSGFWRGSFPAGSSDVSPGIERVEEIERVRAALGALCDETCYADVQLFQADYDGKKFVDAYVVHRPALAAAIERERSFFTRHGILPSTHPAEVLAVVDRLPRADRWRAFGLLFGYPSYAVDFFVQQAVAADERTAAMEAAAAVVDEADHDESESERPTEPRRRVRDREFRHVPTFASATGRFTWAVPIGHREREEDRSIATRAAGILAAYREARAAIVDATDPVAAMHAHRRGIAASGAASDLPPAPPCPTVAAAARTLWALLATGPRAERRMWCLVTGDERRWATLHLDLDFDGRFDPARESFAGEAAADSGEVLFRPPASALGDEHTLEPVSIDAAGRVRILVRWRDRAALCAGWTESPEAGSQFGATPAFAPVIHFDLTGPLDIQRRTVWPQAIAGEPWLVDTLIGRRGRGAGSFAAVSLDDVLPPGTGLAAELCYVDRSGAPRRETFRVLQRDGGCVLFDRIPIPSDAAPGAATIRLHGEHSAFLVGGPRLREQSFAIEIGGGPVEHAVDGASSPRSLPLGRRVFGEAVRQLPAARFGSPPAEDREVGLFGLGREPVRSVRHQAVVMFRQPARGPRRRPRRLRVGAS